MQAICQDPYGKGTFLPAKCVPSWEQRSRVPYTFQALETKLHGPVSSNQAEQLTKSGWKDSKSHCVLRFDQANKFDSGY